MRSYGYGFNGKEKDEDGEWGELTHYDYGFRIYNPGIGRFLSVDPLTSNYANLTPFQFASNSPVANIDLDGLESFFSGKGEYLGGGPINPPVGAAYIYYGGAGNSPGSIHKVSSSRTAPIHGFVGVVGTSGLQELSRHLTVKPNSSKSSGIGRGAWGRFLGVVGFVLMPQSLGNSDIPIVNYDQTLIEHHSTDPSNLSDEYMRGVRERLLNGTATEQDKLYRDHAFRRAIENEGDLTRYKLGENDFDLRGTGTSFDSALERAFELSGENKDEFEVTQFSKTKDGKSIPVEYSHPSGAEISIDYRHLGDGPDAPHIGYKTRGKVRRGTGKKGHLILDEVPAGRTNKKQ